MANEGESKERLTLSFIEKVLKELEQMNSISSTPELGWICLAQDIQIQLLLHTIYLTEVDISKNGFSQKQN